MGTFNTRTVGIGHLKLFGFLLLAPALKLKKFLLRTNRQTPGLLLSTSTQRAARTLATRLLVKANVELGMPMLITHFAPMDTLVSLRARGLSCRKIDLKS